MMIQNIEDENRKSAIAREVLENLMEWFEVEESREGYIRDCREWPFFAAEKDGEEIGFLCLKETGSATVELAVMGVKKAYHRDGVGRMLFDAAKEYAAEAGYEFMQVKTVKMGCYEDYDRTNRFYLGVGFKELEVFPLLWDEANPCQIYVMNLRKNESPENEAAGERKILSENDVSGKQERVSGNDMAIKDDSSSGDPAIFRIIDVRRSYRGKYKPDKVPADHLKKIMEAGLAAPSGCNKQTTSLIAVDDEELLAKLKKEIQPPVAETAPAMILVLTERVNAYRDRCYAVQDYSAAIENMLLAITALGYQSCWYEGHITDEDRIGDRLAKVLGVPEKYDVVCILPVGIAESEPTAPDKRPFAERAWFNGFGK